ncbi:nuclear receptor coactivator protein neosin isoform X1 [Megalopta genalis]|uniref:nuclear receptor coactivator protein neosin isoform X1 n=1 Tax=Megalopta genalis TaxID=115081 RepID=UPI0014432749|nr:transcription initiation factor TFIID subunit 1 isoform X1 [Megalopta genalis]XP_033340460.1 transcription initiation factor TFIID subunit 1 isoform X1 [Megalopta genalis]XP_033340461.1 transcription initiation factor TFIID subunit 1 isoform X1 [Megalopta genalis]XP_033340462.1 transcription initiation factor TFIID subunit 1 isoform X1 [Megalopta genalis]XP_033340463.1 transcription initiation factor TFIID subunit 1 isoform X1 [Megalopta genalis]
MSVRMLKDPATVNCRIFVGHLQTDDMTKHELEEHFSKYGKVIGSAINRGFGFVQFEEEQSAQKAIQNENGAMFKGRRIDVRPAKKDSQSGGGGPKQQGGPNNQFNSNNNHFNSGNDSFNSGNQSFGGNSSFTSNQSFGSDAQMSDTPKGNAIQNRNDQFGDGNQNNEQFGNQNRNNGNDQFNNMIQNKGANQFSPGNQNRGGNQFGPGGNQNKPGGNQNRNVNNQNNHNQSSGGVNSGGGGRARGNRAGKNRNKNRDSSGGNNFRDRSPVNRNARLEDKGGREWDHKQGDRPRNNNFNRDSFNDGNNRYEDFKNSGPRDINMSFNNSSTTSEYSNATTEKNDCEIIVVNKALTEYAESIEARLKKIGLTVDLLFPNEDVLLSRVLGNIASRGCLYAVVVTPINQEHHSLTLNILHGLPQEHRNMLVEDAISLISRDFANYKAGGRSVPLNTPFANERHPDAIQVLLNMLADNHQLTVLQYDRVIKYLEIKREEQVQVELGDVKDLPTTTTTIAVSDPKQAELQSRILNILNSNKTSSTAPVPSPVPAPTSAPTPVPPATWGSAASTATTASTTTTTTGVSPSPLLNDPTVQKALDSLLQGNLLKSIGDQQPATTTTPLFAAFSNIGRF